MRSTPFLENTIILVYKTSPPKISGAQQNAIEHNVIIKPFRGNLRKPRSTQT